MNEPYPYTYRVNAFELQTWFQQHSEECPLRRWDQPTCPCEKN